jgi:hypothetical protein
MVSLRSIIPKLSLILSYIILEAKSVSSRRFLQILQYKKGPSRKNGPF